MDLEQEFEVLKKKEELLVKLITNFESQQHKLVAEMQTLELMIENEKIQNDQATVPQINEVQNHEIDLDPSLQINRNKEIADDEEEEEEEDDNDDEENEKSKKKFTIL